MSLASAWGCLLHQYATAASWLGLGPSTRWKGGGTVCAAAVHRIEILTGISCRGWTAVVPLVRSKSEWLRHQAGVSSAPKAACHHCPVWPRYRPESRGRVLSASFSTKPMKSLIAM
jgi:hypothetical protein